MSSLHLAHEVLLEHSIQLSIHLDHPPSLLTKYPALHENQVVEVGETQLWQLETVQVFRTQLQPSST